MGDFPLTPESVLYAINIAPTTASLVEFVESVRVSPYAGLILYGVLKHSKISLKTVLPGVLRRRTHNARFNSSIAGKLEG
jgi:hypothetical protein